MRRNRKQNIKLLTLILILFIGIGYAALTANLKVDGTVDIDRTTWDVHFENVNITEGSVEANPAPTTNNIDTIEMTYTINFTKPGDFFEFTTDMVNDGTIDAMVDVVDNKTYASNGTTEIELPDYLTSTVTYNDGIEIRQNQELKHGTSEKIKVRVEFKKDITASDLPSSGDTTVVFKFKGDFKQADENAVPKPVVILPTGKTKDTLTTGDVIKIKDEEFYFIRYDGTNNEDIVMLAKYNLKVGYRYSNLGTKTGIYSKDDIGYGKQSSEARGIISGEPRNGIVAFAASNYWYDNGLKPEYGSDYPTDVYDGVNYKTEPEFSTTCSSTNCWRTPGYSIAHYVDNYKTILTGYGATIKDARLLTYSEVLDESIGCVTTTSPARCPTDEFITNTSFWLGTADNRYRVWNIRHEGNLSRVDIYDVPEEFGVRPVIVIAKENI